jgi:predicted HTH domain antitoxin
MTRVEFQVFDGVLASLRCDPDRFSHELRLAAAVKWYESGILSQSRAAEIAGVSRAEFIEELGRFGVSPFQVDADELTGEVLNG